MESFSSHVLLTPCRFLGLRSNISFLEKLFLPNQLMKVSLVTIIPFNLLIGIIAFCNHLGFFFVINLLDHSFFL